MFVVVVLPLLVLLSSFKLSWNRDTVCIFIAQLYRKKYGVRSGEFTIFQTQGFLPCYSLRLKPEIWYASLYWLISERERKNYGRCMLNMLC